MKHYKKTISFFYGFCFQKAEFPVKIVHDNIESLYYAIGTTFRNYLYLISVENHIRLALDNEIEINDTYLNGCLDFLNDKDNLPQIYLDGCEKIKSTPEFNYANDFRKALSKIGQQIQRLEDIVKSSNHRTELINKFLEEQKSITFKNNYITDFKSNLTFIHLIDSPLNEKLINQDLVKNENSYSMDLNANLIKNENKANGFTNDGALNQSINKNKNDKSKSNDMFEKLTTRNESTPLPNFDKDKDKSILNNDFSENEELSELNSYSLQSQINRILNDSTNILSSQTEDDTFLDDIFAIKNRKKPIDNKRRLSEQGDEMGIKRFKSADQEVLNTIEQANYGEFLNKESANDILNDEAVFNTLSVNYDAFLKTESQNDGTIYNDKSMNDENVLNDEPSIVDTVLAEAEIDQTTLDSEFDQSEQENKDIEVESDNDEITNEDLNRLERLVDENNNRDRGIKFSEDKNSDKEMKYANAIKGEDLKESEMQIDDKDSLLNDEEEFWVDLD